MKRLCMWFVLLNKRLYKKISYVGILLLIPVLCLIFSAVAKEQSGVLTIALASENPQEILAKDIISDIKSETLVVSFLETTPQNARELVAAGKADAAWILPADLHSRVKDYVNGEKNSDGFVTVIEQEQTVPLMLSHEKLSSVFHKLIVKEAYLRYLREIAPETQQISDEELLVFLEETDVSGELFEFYDITGNRRNESANYLTTPIRGLLAVLAVICCIVTAMHFQNDLDRGIFSLLPEKSRKFGEFGYQMISALNILVVILVALLISGLSASLWREILIFVLFAICSSLFGMVMRAIFGGGRGLAVLIPILSVVMLALCPIFFDYGEFKTIQFVFPPTYYVNAVYNTKYIWYLVVYDAILFLIYFVLILGKRLIIKKKLR